jgi:hypothetical protein
LELAGTTSVLSRRGTYRSLPDTGIPLGTAELSATGTVATSVLGPVALPGAGLLVPRTMALEIRVLAERRAIPAPRHSV